MNLFSHKTAEQIADKSNVPAEIDGWYRINCDLYYSGTVEELCVDTAYSAMVAGSARLQIIICTDGPITVGEFRDRLFGYGKYAPDFTGE